METAPADYSANLEPVRRGGDQLVCLRGGRALPAVLLADERAPAGRCSLSLVQETVSPSEDYGACAAKNQRGKGDSASSCTKLAQPAVVPRVGGASNVADRSLISGKGLGVAPQTGAMEPTHLAGQRGEWTLNVSQRDLDTIAEARAPSTRHLYSLKWKVFASWRMTRDEDPASCDVSVILSFLQDCLDAGRMPSTLKVYVAAISVFHLPFGDRSVGRHHLVMGFFRGARRLRPIHPNMVPVWDLSMVLNALSEPPFEPLVSAELKVLSFKTTLLLALACGKRVGDLHCLRVLQAWSSVRMTVWSDCSLDEGMCLKCFLCHLESRSLCYKCLLLRIQSQQCTRYAQYMLCEFIWRGLVISDWRNSCLYVSVTVPKDCQCQNSDCHIGLWK